LSSARLWGSTNRIVVAVDVHAIRRFALDEQLQPIANLPMLQLRSLLVTDRAFCACDRETWTMELMIAGDSRKALV